MEVNQLLIQYFEARISKVINIKNQKYEIAASLRDDERSLSIKIFRLIKGDCNDLDYRQAEDEINEYCLREFGCGVYDSDCLKSIKRHIKLNNLGI